MVRGAIRKCLMLLLGSALLRPEVGTEGPHIGKKIPRTAIVNGADSRGEHYDIAWALEIF